MQLTHAADVPVSERDQVFYNSRRRALGGVALIIIGAGAASYFIGLRQPGLGYYVLAVIGVGMWCYRKMTTARFHPANWLVRLSDDGAFIKFRSYLNSHFPDQEPTAVFIPPSEIRGARRIVGKQEVPELDDNNRPTNSSKTIKRVELELAGDSNSLAGAVDRERRYVSEGNARLKIISRYHHLPVRLPTADKLQIEWEVVPCAGFFLNALSRRTPVHDAENILTDFVNLEKLSREEQENRLRQLAESGDKLGAIAVARRLYACDLTQAKDLVEGLVSKRSSQAS